MYLVLRRFVRLQKAKRRRTSQSFLKFGKLERITKCILTYCLLMLTIMISLSLYRGDVVGNIVTEGYINHCDVYEEGEKEKKGRGERRGGEIIIPIRIKCAHLHYAINSNTIYCRLKHKTKRKHIYNEIYTFFLAQKKKKGNPLPKRTTTISHTRAGIG